MNRKGRQGREGTRTMGFPLRTFASFAVNAFLGLGLFRSRNRKGKDALCRYPDFLFAGGGSNSCSGSSARARADGSAFAASGYCSNQRTGACAATDFCGIALGVALALAAHTRAINSLSVDGTQAQSERAGFVEASAAIHVGDLAFDRSARVDHDFAMFNNVMRERAAPDFAAVRCG